jgi:hypothetical protein
VTTAVAYSRDNAPAVYSTAVYALAVAGAVYGQLDAARIHGLPWEIGLISAIAIEGTGLAMALTAHQLRLAKERAIIPRVLTWLSTAIAVGINFVGHAGLIGGVKGDPITAFGLGFLSLIGITVWEVRSAAKHRQVLRTAGVIPEPPERFGWRRWMAAPVETWHAWRLDARTRVSPGAAALIARTAADRTARAANRRRESIRVEARQMARKAARVAARKGATGDALEALMRLATLDSTALALPSAPLAESTQARESVSRPEPVSRVDSESTQAAPPVRESAQPAPAQPIPTQRSTQALAARESAQPDSSTPALPAGREPVRRRTLAAHSDAMQLTVSAHAGEPDIEAAFVALCRDLGREPSGSELAGRAGISKATANRWKSNRPTSDNA